MSPRTPRTPEPGLPRRRAELVDEGQADDGAIYRFWEWVMERRTVLPSDNDEPGWRRLLEDYEAR